MFSPKNRKSSYVTNYNITENRKDKLRKKRIENLQEIRNNNRGIESRKESECSKADKNNKCCCTIL